MRSRRRHVAAVALAGFALLAVVAVTATNTVASSRAYDVNGAGATANQLKPSACAGLDLGAVAFVDGTDADELVLGTPAGESLRGQRGDDCILGGGGDDNLRGDHGTDVCIGGPGTDTFHPSCETQIQ